MARHIYVDRADRDGFTVRILAGLRGDRTHEFADRDEARQFATSKLGRQGILIDTTDVTPEQLAIHKDRERKMADLVEAIGKTAQTEKRRK